MRRVLFNWNQGNPRMIGYWPSLVGNKSRVFVWTLPDSSVKDYWMVTKWVIRPQVTTLASTTVRILGCNKRINLKLYNCVNDVLMKAWPVAPMSFIACVIWETSLQTIVHGRTKWSQGWWWNELTAIVKLFCTCPWGQLNPRTSLFLPQEEVCKESKPSSYP